jgi:hypothetical protein
VLYFYLSYAPGQDDQAVQQFFHDLDAEVRMLAGAGPAGIVGLQTPSGENLQTLTGEKWSEGLSECRAFVALYSPRYFASYSCGREWSIFTERIALLEQSTGRRIPALIPVLWLPVSDMPPVARGLQFATDEFGEAYTGRGLRQLARLKRYRDAYLSVVSILAQQIVRVAEEGPLPPPPTFDFDSVPSAFHVPPNAPHPVETSSASLDIKAGPPPGDVEDLSVAPARPGSDHVDWVADAPARRDTLMRSALASVLARRLHQAHRQDPGVSFLVHLDGPWGAGKSTLLGLIGKYLGSEFDVVVFEAWRNLPVKPSWWALLATLRTGIASRLGFWGQVALRLRETWARTRRTGTAYWLSLVLLAGLTSGLWWLFAPALTAPGIEGVAKVIVAVGAAGALLWGGSRLAGRLFLWESARGARLYEQSHEDPMRGVAEHFAWLLRQSRRPVVIFIEDLDRCPAADVVELLDTVQTLVRDAPGHDRRRQTAAHVVVAADGAWLRHSYESMYETFREPVSRPGRPLGYLFLDKMFQMTIPVPMIGPDGQASYLRSLLRTALPGESGEDPAEADRVRRQIRGSRSESELLSVLGAATPGLREELAASAVDQLGTPGLVADTEHALERYSPLLPPNPRSVKRFLNMYSVLRAVRTAEGSVVPIETLATWTALRVRWPGLADILEANPEWSRALAGDQAHGNPPDELRPVTESEEFRQFVRLCAGGFITPEQIRACCGATPYQPGPVDPESRPGRP